MEIAPYLSFNGQCREAFEFYAKCLGGRIEFIHTHGESPMRDQTPPELHDRIMHVRLVVDGRAIMGADAPPAYFSPAQGMTVSVSVPGQADAERIFRDLSQGGRVMMPFAKTFWSAGFGMLVDRFGIPWMVNCEAPA